VLVSAGFVSYRVEKQVFVKCDSADPGIQCVVLLCIDNCLAICYSSLLTDALFAPSELRFGMLAINPVTRVRTGLEISPPPDGGVLVFQDQAMAKAVSLIGVSHLPPITVPAIKTFFIPPTDPIECVPVDVTMYSSPTGKLVQLLKTRFDVEHYVSELCSHNHAPLMYHYR
jgi:hypothetical protein